MTSSSTGLQLKTTGTGPVLSAPRVHTQGLHIEKGKLSMVRRTLEDGFALTKMTDVKLGKISGIRTSFQGYIFSGRGTKLKGGLSLPHP